MKILLVSMPFGALERQALGISILKPLLRAHGHDCDLKYLTFAFAGIIGIENYQWISYQAPYTAFAGDWCFTEELYGKTTEADYEEKILRSRWRVDEDGLARVRTIRNSVARFLDYAMEAVSWQDYQAVGFTSTFEQNLASLALAKRLRARYPKLKIIMGGANWEDEMGLELHRQFPFIDAACSGEAEHSFPALLDALASPAKQLSKLRAIPGIVYRYRGESYLTGKSVPVQDLNSLPTPDFSDYFDALHQSSVSSYTLPTLLFESSRGCWWGARSHCTFCGLNGNSMAFRSKTPARALTELKEQVERWRVPMVEAVDNILDMSYFKEFLPALADAKLGVELFYEVKANLSRRHLKMLREAGVMRLQPGIESLSNHVLQLMKKGTTGLQNIQMMKWSAEYGIHSDWNLLYGFPGETSEDYDEILAILPAMRHLSPPTACGPLRLDRFSPYHHTPEQYGLSNLRAIDSMAYLYPFAPEVLMRISYYFDFDYPDGRDAAAYAQKVIDYCANWKQQNSQGTLHAALMPDGTLGLLDQRSSRAALRLAGWQQEVYERCDTARNFRHLLDLAEAETLQPFLDEMCHRLFMVRQGEQYLSLALASGPLRTRLEQQEQDRIRPNMGRPVLTSSPFVVLSHEAEGG